MDIESRDRDALLPPPRTATKVVLLPGLDGTGLLFRDFLAAAPQRFASIPLALPSRSLSYRQLAETLLAQLPPDENLAIVAESFSGPLAAIVAARRPLRALVLCNSFVAAPLPGILRWLVLPALFRLKPPAFLVRRYLLGAEAAPELVNDVVAAVRSVPADVIASRIRAVLTVDETEAFSRTSVPTLYLRGTCDRLVSERSYRRLAALRQISHAEIAAPHLVLQTCAQQSWREIARFLDSLS